jgi:hypothetical protein
MSHVRYIVFTLLWPASLARRHCIFVASGLIHLRLTRFDGDPFYRPQNKGMQDDFPVDRYRAATGASSWGLLHSHEAPQPGNPGGLGNGSEAAQLRWSGDAVTADDRPDVAATASMQASCLALT